MDQKYLELQLICLFFFGEVIWRFVYLDLNFFMGVVFSDMWVFVVFWDRCVVLELGLEGDYYGVIFRDIWYLWIIVVGFDYNKLVVFQYKNIFLDEIKRFVKFFQFECEFEM